MRTSYCEYSLIQSFVLLFGLYCTEQIDVFSLGMLTIALLFRVEYEDLDVESTLGGLKWALSRTEWEEDEWRDETR